mmetsp:Transcript_10071/g.39216  ORF Transcript_10071/g.39216 Transcript_10071/m.39216 type:complete len:240 (+) Transcript_10071:371-1090(+)
MRGRQAQGAPRRRRALRGAEPQCRSLPGGAGFAVAPRAFPLWRPLLQQPPPSAFAGSGLKPAKRLCRLQRRADGAPARRTTGTRTRTRTRGRTTQGQRGVGAWSCSRLGVGGGRQPTPRLEAGTAGPTPAPAAPLRRQPTRTARRASLPLTRAGESAPPSRAWCAVACTWPCDCLDQTPPCPALAAGPRAWASRSAPRGLARRWAAPGALCASAVTLSPTRDRCSAGLPSGARRPMEAA